MKTNLTAKIRNEHGSSASRRLRRNGEVPAIIYGSDNKAMPISLDHNTIYYALKNEEFHTSILNIDVDGTKEKVLLRSSQLHAYKQQVLHVDFQRVSEKEEIHIRIPLHFINEEVSHAVKVQSAHITHIVNDVEIKALAKDIPHFIEIDMKDIQAGQTIHLSNLALPKGVQLVSLIRGEDAAVANASGIVEEVEAAQEAVSVADIPTVEEKKSEE